MPRSSEYLKPRQHRLLRSVLYRHHCPACDHRGGFTLRRSREATCTHCHTSLYVRCSFTKPWRQDNIRWHVHHVHLEQIQERETA